MRILFYILFLYSSLRAQPKLYTFSDVKMGTEFTIKVFGDDSAKINTAVHIAWRKIDEINSVFSDYIQSSELAHVHHHTGNWVDISTEFEKVVKIAQVYAKVTDGAFDISVGTLSRLWRRSIKMNEFPSNEKINEAVKHVGYKKLKLKKNRIYIPRGMLLDFGAIAKGYAVDKAFKVLVENGYTQCMVDGGGDIYIGDGYDSRGWGVMVSLKSEMSWMDSIMYLQHAGIATSGDRYKFIQDSSGNSYAHIINPKTGYGVKGPLLTTVIAEDATIADILATALSVDPSLEKKLKRRLKLKFNLLYPVKDH